MEWEFEQGDLFEVLDMGEGNCEELRDHDIVKFIGWVEERPDQAVFLNQRNGYEFRTDNWQHPDKLKPLGISEPLIEGASSGVN